MGFRSAWTAITSPLAAWVCCYLSLTSRIPSWLCHWLAGSYPPVVTERSLGERLCLFSLKIPTCLMPRLAPRGACLSRTRMESSCSPMPLSFLRTPSFLLQVSYCPPFNLGLSPVFPVKHPLLGTSGKRLDTAAKHWGIQQSTVFYSRSCICILTADSFSVWVMNLGGRFSCWLIFGGFSFSIDMGVPGEGTVQGEIPSCKTAACSLRKPIHLCSTPSCQISLALKLLGSNLILARQRGLT